MSKHKAAPIPKAPKMPFSFRKHIVPPLAGVTAMILVLAALNAELIWARAHYTFYKPQASAAIIIHHPDATPVTPAPKPDPNKPATIEIPSIGVNAPVIFSETTTVEWRIQIALRSGTVHYGTTAVPGQNTGNVVIIGHSSGQPWAPGDYKWVFTLLNQVKVGDQIQINYQGIPYIYQVTDTRVISPDDTSVLNQTDSPTLSLITCTPVGTSKNRLVVHAKQISPAPAEATAPVVVSKPKTTTKVIIPGSDHNTSLWQTIKSWF